MRRALTKAFLFASLATCTFLASQSAVRAQSIEPRSYSNAPVGVNFLVGGYAYTRGGISFDTLPITDPKLTTSSGLRLLQHWHSTSQLAHWRTPPPRRRPHRPPRRSRCR